MIERRRREGREKSIHMEIGSFHTVRLLSHAPWSLTPYVSIRCINGINGINCVMCDVMCDMMYDVLCCAVLRVIGWVG